MRLAACDTGKLYFFTHNYSTFKAPYIVYYIIYIIRTKVSVTDIRYRSTYIKAKRPIFPAFFFAAHGVSRFEAPFIIHSLQCRRIRILTARRTFAIWTRAGRRPREEAGSSQEAES